MSDDSTRVPASKLQVMDASNKVPISNSEDEVEVAPEIKSHSEPDVSSVTAPSEGRNNVVAQHPPLQNEPVVIPMNTDIISPEETKT